MIDVVEKQKEMALFMPLYSIVLGYPASMITPVQIIRAQTIQDLTQPVSVFMDAKLHFIEIHESMKNNL